MSNYYEEKSMKAKEIFKEHRASYTKVMEGLSILDWQKSETSIYRIRYVFDQYRVYISGDVGHAVLWLTWDGSDLESFEGVGLHYLRIELPRTEERGFLGCTSPSGEVSEHRLPRSFRPLAICER